MTSLPARPQYKGCREDTSFSSSLTVFVWSMHSGKNTVFSLSWRARRLRLCVDPRYRYWHPMTHTIFALFCLGKEHACDVLEGKICVHCEFFLWKAPLSSVPLFKERGAAVCFPRFGTHRCRGTEAIEIVGFAVGYGRWVREGPPLFVHRPRTRVSCWIVILWSCDIIRFSG